MPLLKAAEKEEHIHPHYTAGKNEARIIPYLSVNIVNYR